VRHDEVRKSAVGLEKREGVLGFVGRSRRWEWRYETLLRRKIEPKGGRRCVRESAVRVAMRVCMTSSVCRMNVCERKGEKMKRTDKVFDQHFFVDIYRARLGSLPYSPPLTHFPVPVPEGSQRRSNNVLDLRYAIQILYCLCLFSSGEQSTTD
jgi:hypothetical protein